MLILLASLALAFEHVAQVGDIQIEREAFTPADPRWVVTQGDTRFLCRASYARTRASRDLFRIAEEVEAVLESEGDREPRCIGYDGHNPGHCHLRVSRDAGALTVAVEHTDDDREQTEVSTGASVEEVDALRRSFARFGAAASGG